MTERVCGPVLGDRAALPDRALGRDHERRTRGVEALVLDKDLDKPVEIEGHFGDEATGRGHIGGVQRAESGVTAEDTEDADALVRAERRSLPVDELLRPRDRG